MEKECSGRALKKAHPKSTGEREQRIWETVHWLQRPWQGEGWPEVPLSRHQGWVKQGLVSRRDGL